VTTIFCGDQFAEMFVILYH